MQEEIRQPLPPFNFESATKKVQMAENGWNLKNPEKIATAYSLDSKWRNRNLFINGRDEIISFLENKYLKELNYKLCKELWAYTEDRIAVRFAYEWHDDNGQWYRSYGNENWEFNEKGLMKVRFASINDLAINKSDRKLLWEEDTRPEDYPSLSKIGL
ncbi:DUF1348 family protein [Sulfurimonas sp. CS5]|uniref:nuclear transport factor 2 family protein n=1 Tax=Sulfurimonas sp. CS5 TaxID=3391145 RepID=UPI0039E9DB1B